MNFYSSGPHIPGGTWSTSDSGVSSVRRGGVFQETASSSEAVYSGLHPEHAQFASGERSLGFLMIMKS